MTTRKQLALHLDDDTARALEAEARLRGLTLSRTANDGLRRVLLDERDISCARDMALLRETLLAFIRLWLTYAGPIDLDPDDTSPEQRFEAFLDDVVQGLEVGAAHSVRS